MRVISILFFLFMFTTSTLYPIDLKKKIYDATSYTNKNRLNQYIFPSIPILYEDMLLPKGAGNIDFEFLKKYAHSLPYSKIPYILDIESWDIRPKVFDFIANPRIDKYIAVIKTLKEARPDLKFGYYGILPVRDYVTVNPSQRQLKKWHEANLRVKRLSQYVDIICPDLYTFFKDKKYWKTYASLAIKDARMYGKPVIPFIWPEYHDASKDTPYTYINPSFWKLQVEYLSSHADGMIVWGGRNLNVTPHTSKKWDDKAPWWQIIKNTILKK
ncbi:MAG: hypothetical protein L3J43_05745 [Sulfurovum sp.]|nr:hypothetical protein [Sulfurovum sp.]